MITEFTSTSKFKTSNKQKIKKENCPYFNKVTKQTKLSTQDKSLKKSEQNSEVYLGPGQTSMMELFEITINIISSR